jgi:hypothetical protein
MCAVALRRPRNSQSSAGIPGAKRAPFPGFIEPCDPTLRDRASDGPGWLHEIKIDGYRAQVQEMKTICDEFEAYGYRRVDAELRHRGIIVNAKKIRRLMREH